MSDDELQRSQRAQEKMINRALHLSTVAMWLVIAPVAVFILVCIAGVLYFWLG